MRKHSGSGRGNTVRSFVRSYIRIYRNTGTDRVKKKRATRMRSFSFRPPATSIRGDVKHRTGGSARKRKRERRGGDIVLGMEPRFEKRTIRSDQGFAV